jgi:hypothetical protein
VNIDERLEALAQSVEILALEQRDNEKRFVAMQEQADRQFAELRADLRQQFAQVSQLFTQTDGFINSLARIAQTHQQRIDDHEQRIDTLEKR